MKIKIIKIIMIIVIIIIMIIIIIIIIIIVIIEIIIIIIIIIFFIIIIIIIIIIVVIIISLWNHTVHKATRQQSFYLISVVRLQWQCLTPGNKFSLSVNLHDISEIMSLFASWTLSVISLK